MSSPSFSYRIVEVMSAWATQKRGIVLAVAALVALAFGLQIPKLRVDSSPSALASTVPGLKSAQTDFERIFQRSSSQVIVVLQSKSLTAEEELRYQYRLHQRLQGIDEVSACDGLTKLTLLKPPSDGGVDTLDKEANPTGPGMKQRALPPESAILEKLSESTGLSQAGLTALIEGDEEFYARGVYDLAERLDSDDRTASLTSADFTNADYQTFKEALDETEWVKPALLSHDEDTAALIVHFDSKLVFDQKSRMGALREVREAISTVQKPEGLTVRVGGVPALRESILSKLQKDRFTLNPAMMIICLLILGFTFRWWAAVIAPICAVGIAALMVIGGMASIDQPLSILTNIIPALLIIVGLSDSVHLVGRYHEELQITPERRVAGRNAARAMLVACFLTSLTTAVGFGSLALAETDELGRFGIAAASGVVFAYFATVFFVPAFITQCKTPASWLVHQRNGEARVGPIERLVFNLTLLVLRHAKAIAAATLVATALFGLAASQIKVDARLLDSFDEEDEVSVVTTLLEKELTGIRPLEVMLRTDKGSLLDPQVLQAIDDASTKLLANPEILAISSYRTGLDELRGSLAANTEVRKRKYSSLAQTEALFYLTTKEKEDEPNIFISEDARAARLTAYFTDAGVKRSLELVTEFEADLKERLPQNPAVRVDLLGEAYTGSVGSNHVLSDLVSGLGLALITIFGLLALLFRSVKMGIVAMPSNLVPLLATAAYMMARGTQLNMTTVITFSIGIGLAVDDTVHVVARFREERRRISSVRVALLRAARGTGRAIVITAISLTAGFSVLLFSEFVSVRHFGELIAVTVLNCLVGALLIQPALLLLVTKKRKAKGNTTTLSSASAI